MPCKAALHTHGSTQTWSLAALLLGSSVGPINAGLLLMKNRVWLSNIKTRLRLPEFLFFSSHSHHSLANFGDPSTSVLPSDTILDPTVVAYHGTHHSDHCLCSQLPLVGDPRKLQPWLPLPLPPPPLGEGFCTSPAHKQYPLATCTLPALCNQSHRDGAAESAPFLSRG